MCDMIPAHSPVAQADSVGGNGSVTAPADVPGDSSPLALPPEAPVCCPLAWELRHITAWELQHITAWELRHITAASPVLQWSDLHLELQDAPTHTHWNPSCHPPVNLAKAPAARQAHCQVPCRSVIRHQGGVSSSATWDHLSALDNLDR